MGVPYQVKLKDEERTGKLSMAGYVFIDGLPAGSYERIRDAAGLVPGEPLSVRVRDGRVEIEPAPRQVKIVKRGAVRVAQGAGEPLTEDVVTSTRAALRRRND